MNTATEILDKHGVAIAMLAAIGIGVWKGLWPVGKDFVATLLAMLQTQIRESKEQVLRAEARNDRITNEFLQKLDLITTTSKAANDHLQHTNDQTVEELKRISQSVEKLTK